MANEYKNEFITISIDHQLLITMKKFGYKR